MLKSGTRRAGMDVRLKYSPNSRPSARTLVPTSVARARRSTGLSLNRKLLTAPDHLAVLDQVDAVAGEPGEQHGGRVDLPDVPEAGEQEAPLGPGDEVLERTGGSRHLEEQVADEAGRLDPRAGRPGPVVAQPLEPSAGDPRRAVPASGRCRRPTCRRRTAAAVRKGEHSRPGSGRVAPQVERDRGERLRPPGSLLPAREKPCVPSSALRPPARRPGPPSDRLTASGGSSTS